MSNPPQATDVRHDPPGAPVTTAPALEPASLPKRAAALGVRYFMVLVLIGLLIAAHIAYSPFFTAGNIKTALSQIAPTGLVAVGMTFVIISGGFDLSVGAIYAVGATLFADFWLHVSPPVAVAGALAAGGVCGLFNGLVVTKLRINAFVVTLGTASLFTGLAYVVSHSAPVIVSSTSFGVLGTNNLIGVPISVWILFAAVLIGGLVLARSTFGRSVYAVGGNVEAARLAGLRVDTIKIVCFVIVGVLAALGGMILASQTGDGEGDYGSTIALNAIAIVVIGGTSLLGGEGAMWKTVIGILILGTINNMFNALALSTADQSVIEGLVILLAVVIDSRARGLLIRTAKS
jgi:ribose/xylose/arabinose/galactoside ABC-type transport system permease subunit